MELAILGLELGDSAGHGISFLELTAASFGGEGCEGALVALATPGEGVGGVEALAAEQGAELAGVAQRIGFLEDLEPVLRGELPALSPLDDFRIRRPVYREAVSFNHQIPAVSRRR